MSALVIQEVEDASDAILVRARTRGEAVACPGCGAETSRVHGYHERTAADVEIYARTAVAQQAGLPDEAIQALRNGEPANELADKENLAQAYCSAIDVEALRRCEPVREDRIRIF